MHARSCVAGQWYAAAATKPLPVLNPATTERIGEVDLIDRARLDATPASPLGGVKESGYGADGGTEGMDAYLVTKSVTTRAAGPDLLP